jgi:hypothetical protein
LISGSGAVRIRFERVRLQPHRSSHKINAGFRCCGKKSVRIRISL